MAREWVQHQVSDLISNGKLVVGDGYRAIGIREGDTIVWEWIGTHNDYNPRMK